MASHRQQQDGLGNYTMAWPQHQQDAHGNYIAPLFAAPPPVPGLETPAPPAVKGQRNLFAYVHPDTRVQHQPPQHGHARMPSAPTPTAPPPGFGIAEAMGAQCAVGRAAQQLPQDAYTNVNSYIAPHHPDRPAWKISRKNMEGLFKFDGEGSQYRPWKSRIRDHCSEEWPQWRDVLDHAEKVPYELRTEQLQNMTLFGVNAAALSSD